MNEAVFIADLHLAPERADIWEKFQNFLQWAPKNTKTVYILGDFMHVWPGDDACDSWSAAITQRLAALVDQGVAVYFMPGNRDFLIGQRFLEEAKLVALPDPCVIRLSDERVLLAHGDRYCTKDWAHQCLRKLTRNRLFSRLFLRLPYRLRVSIVQRVRQHSRSKQYPSPNTQGVVVKDMLADLQHFKTTTIIHGHTHQPGLTVYPGADADLKQYILSDWDDNPMLLCYNRKKMFFTTLGSNASCLPMKN